jgi:hypothetical protein
VAEGVRVLVLDGPGGGHFGGAQHSKSLRVDMELLCGSCNWTGNSRGNYELAVAVSLNEKGVREFEAMFLGRFSRGKPFTSGFASGSGDVVSDVTF